MSRLGLVFTLALAMLFACAGVVLAQSQSPDDGQATEGEEFVEDISGLEAGDPIPGKYIVVLEDRVADPASVADDLSADLDLETTNVYDDALEGFAAEVPSGELRELRSDSRVKSVVQDRVVEAAQKSAARVKRIDRSQRSIRSIVQNNRSTKKAPKKQSRKQKPSQEKPVGIKRIDADVSTAKAGDGKGKVNADIAVLDSGIYKKHKDLNVAGGVNCLGKKRMAWHDGYGHGTHVAGTAAARDNKIGVVGVVPGARLWAVKVLDSDGLGSVSSVTCGVDWVTARAGTIEVANMSLVSDPGTGSDDGDCGNTIEDPLHRAICNSVEAGVLYTVAAGNENVDFTAPDTRTIPAAYDEVLTVTAVSDFNGRPGGGASRTCRHDRDDTAANFSNFTTAGGPDQGHTIAAPGVCIRSTWNNGKYDVISGTSMASSHVAGTAALCIANGPCSAGDPEGTKETLLSDADAQPKRYGFAGDPNDPIGTRYYGYLTYAGGY